MDEIKLYKETSMCCFRGTNSSSRGGSKGQRMVLQSIATETVLDSNIPTSPYITKMRLQNKETLPLFWPHSMQDLSSTIVRTHAPCSGIKES